MLFPNLIRIILRLGCQHHCTVLTVPVCCLGFLVWAPLHYYILYCIDRAVGGNIFSRPSFLTLSDHCRLSMCPVRPPSTMPWGCFRICFYVQLVAGIHVGRTPWGNVTLQPCPGPSQSTAFPRPAPLCLKAAAETHSPQQKLSVSCGDSS